MTIQKYDTNLVKAGNSMAKSLETNQSGGVSQIDIMSATKTLTQLEGLKPKTTGEKSSLTRVVNRLSEAIQESHVNPNVRGLPARDSGRIIMKIRADDPGTGPVIFKIRADDPLPKTSFTPEKVDQFRLALQMMDKAPKFKAGGFIQSQPIGSQNFESVTIRDDRPRDGNALRVFVQAGQLNHPSDPNKATQFFLESESLRGGKSWAGPFDIGAAGMKMATTVQAHARDIAEQAGAKLSRSDGVTLKNMVERSDGKLHVTLSVHHFLSPDQKRGEVTALLDVGGKFLSGSFKGSPAHPLPVIEPKPGTHLAGILTRSADAFAERLGFPKSRSDGKISFEELKQRKDGGFDATYNVPSWDGRQKSLGKIHASVDDAGKLQTGFWTRGPVPSKVLKKLDTYAEIFAVAEKAGKSSGHAISKSHTVDLVGVREENGKFRAVLHVNHWQTGQAAWMVNALLDKDGAYKSGGVSQS